MSATYRRRLASLLSTLLLAVTLGIGLSARAQEEDELTPGVAAYNAGKYEQAAVAFYKIAENGNDALNRQKAEYYLAETFLKMDLYQPAFEYYGLIVRQGARHRYYFKAVEGLVKVDEAVGDETVIPSVLNRAYGADFEKLPDDVLNKVNYLVGTLSYRANKVDEAQEFLSSVPPKSTYYARARYLYGITITIKRPQDAIKIFKEIMALPRTSGQFDLDNVQQLTRLALARTYYGLGQSAPDPLAMYAEAVSWYDSVPRFSEYWDQALFENGWALFQDLLPGRALGSLEALHAPQFEGAFSPESWILKGTIYFYSCLYPETKGAIAGFRRIYLPMDDKIKAALTGEHDFEFYAGLVSRPTGELPLAVVNYLSGNKRVEGFRNYLVQLQKEKVKLGGYALWKDNGLANELAQFIDTQSQTLLKLTGKFVQGRLKNATVVIENFDSQAEIILFETLKAEKELIEKNVDVQARLQEQKLYRPVVPGPAWDYWHFEGEFWIDEIGYYQYTLKNACALRQGQDTSPAQREAQ
jgi:tetratricopeptide (TPR) repeat protein